MATIDQNTKNELRVGSYDRVSSWLVSLLVVAIVTVGSLLIIYFTRQLIVVQYAVPITPVAAESGGGGTGGIGPQGVGTDLEPPGAEDAPLFDEPPLAETLTAVTSAVSSRSALIADDAVDEGIEPVESGGLGDRRRPGFGGGTGGGVGGGVGAGVGRASGGPGEPRRIIRFEPRTLLEYAQWLDFFKIELGVLGRDNKVYYAYNLSQSSPGVRVGSPADEQRLFMNPADSQFAALDRQLAAKAGIADKGTVILQFYPPPAQAILYDLEQKHAGLSPDQIRSTVFRVTHTGNQFVFSVEEQSAR
jgi:hypothetical protein